MIDPDGAEPATPDSDAYGRFGRRAFLGGSASVAAGLVSLRTRSPKLADRLAAEHEKLLASGGHALVPNVTPSLTLAVERDTDLLLLDMAFYDFKVNSSASPKYIEAGPNNVVLVVFPPQAIGEAAYFNDTASGPLPTDPAPVLSVLASPSLLSFSLAPFSKIKFKTMTVADVLDWEGWNLNVPAGARAGTSDPPLYPAAPKSGETFIECPYGLYLSPVVDAHSFETSIQTFFVPRREPVTTNNVTACWSAQLQQYEEQAAVAAVYSRDYDGSPVFTGASATPATYIKYTS